MALEEIPSLSQDVMRGTKWYVLMRWTIRALGFISSAVLARLLMPEDFGLVAIVLVIFGLVSILFEFGVNWALIQNNNATDDHFNTAWTVRLIQSFVVSVALAGAASFIADFYGDGRLENICYILAFGVLIRGFENIGVVKLQKEMKFSHDFSYNVVPKIIATFVTIGLAFYFRSYMALVVGTVMNNLIIVLASYVVVRFKPKFSFGEMSEIWGFSKWILMSNIAQYINSQGVIFLLSMISTPVKIGYYKWGAELSFMTISEIQQPFSRALVPGLVKIKNEPQRLIAAYLRALGLMTLVAVPVALGFGAVAKELIPIFLGGGDKWLPVVPLIQALVIFAMFTSMYGVSGSLLNITGNVKYMSHIYWIQALVTLMTLYPAYYIYGLEGVAYSRALIGFIMFFVVSFFVVSRCPVSIKEIMLAIWRPVISGLIMYFILIEIPHWQGLEGWLVLMMKIAIGSILYMILTLFLWSLAGKPKSAESEFLELTKQVLKLKSAKC